MMQTLVNFFRGLLLAFSLVSAAHAAGTATPAFADPALEARVMAIAVELRCLVCQNENIAASHAELAVDLRMQIREQLQAGRSQQQILDFMAERYGEFVLYRPLLKAQTVLLWAGPFVLLLLGGYALFKQARSRPESVDAEWTAADLARAQQLLDSAPAASGSAPDNLNKNMKGRA